MKKLRFSRMMALLLALVLCLSAVQMPVAMAADDSDGVPDVTDADLDNTGANTPAPVERKFDVWAPQYLDIVLKSDGTLELPTGDRARIYNKSADIVVQVSEISVEALNGWTLVPWTADFAVAPVDSKNIALKLRGDVLDSETGKLALTKDRWVIAADNYLDLEFEAKIPDFNTKQDSVPVARVTFKLAWGEPVVVAKTFKIDFEDRDGGKIADLTTLETDENGIVPELPAVNLDDGYTFDHYEDETGRTVKAGDKIAEDVKLHPILTKTEPEPEKAPAISFEDRDGGKITGDKTPIECPDKLVPEKLPEVTPDDKHEFKGWADAGDNPVEPGDKLDGDITLHPVFVAKPDQEPEPEKAPVISFEDRDGGEIADKTPIECPDGVVPKLPVVTPDAKHEFTGWADVDDKPVKEGDPIEADVTLHPVFVEKPPVITFVDDDHGAVDNKDAIACPDKIVPELPGATPADGWKFDGYVDQDGNPVKATDEILVDKILKPVFVEDLITVTFTSNIDNAFAENVELTASVRRGSAWSDVAAPEFNSEVTYDFTGWFKGEEKLADDAVLDSDLTVTAIFDTTPKNVIVTFKASKYNGTIDGVSSLEVPVGTTWGSLTDQLPKTTAGLSATFMGWETGAEVETLAVEPAEGFVALTDDYVISKDMTATARFESWFTHTNDTVTGFSDAYELAGKPAVITIPQVIDGKKLTIVGDRAFRLQEHLTGITLQSGYKTIKSWAFAQCFIAESLSLPDTVTTIGRSAFKAFGMASEGKLGTLRFASTLVSIDEQAFASSGWREVIVPDGPVVSGHNTFSRMPYVTKLFFGDGSYDFSYTFQYNDNLKEIYLPSTTSTIGRNSTFLGLPALTYVRIDVSSGRFSSELSRINESTFAPKARVVYWG